MVKTKWTIKNVKQIISTDANKERKKLFWLFWIFKFGRVWLFPSDWSTGRREFFFTQSWSSVKESKDSIECLLQDCRTDQDWGPPFDLWPKSEARGPNIEEDKTRTRKWQVGPRKRGINYYFSTVCLTASGNYLSNVQLNKIEGGTETLRVWYTFNWLDLHRSPCPSLN